MQGEEEEVWQEEPDFREAARLELIGLASEVVTLARCIEDALSGANRALAAELFPAWNTLAIRASEILSPDTNLEQLSTAALERVALAMQEDQRQMRDLRQRITRLIQSGSGP